jgi:hypothetical protein
MPASRNSNNKPDASPPTRRFRPPVPQRVAEPGCFSAFATLPKEFQGIFWFAILKSQIPIENLLDFLIAKQQAKTHQKFIRNSSSK